MVSKNLGIRDAAVKRMYEQEDPNSALPAPELVWNDERTELTVR